MTIQKRSFQKLTAKDVEKVLRGKYEDGRHIDGQGLSILVRSGGSAASWVFVHNPPLPAKQRQYTVGSVAALAKGAGDASPYQMAAHSLAEARRIAATMREAISKGLPVRVTKEPVEGAVQWADILDYYCSQKKIETASMSKYVAPWESIIKGEQVYTRDMAIKYRDRLLKTIKPITVRGYIKMLGAVFNLYIIDKQADIKNPFIKLSVEIEERDVERRHPMPAEMIQKMRTKLKGDDLLIWDLIAVTGARIGEIVGIKSADILDGAIRIESNSKRSIKNGVSRRVIPHPFKLPKRESEYYFDQSVNAATCRHSILIKDIRDGNEKITGHSLRHSVTDRLRENDIEFVHENFFLGHANKDVAAKTYGSVESRFKVLADKVGPVIEAYATDLKIPLDRMND